MFSDAGSDLPPSFGLGLAHHNLPVPSPCAGFFLGPGKLSYVTHHTSRPTAEGINSLPCLTGQYFAVVWRSRNTYARVLFHFSRYLSLAFWHCVKAIISRIPVLWCYQLCYEWCYGIYQYFCYISNCCMDFSRAISLWKLRWFGQSKTTLYLWRYIL